MTFFGSRPSRAVEASMMRRLAWCETNRSTSRRREPVARQAGAARSPRSSHGKLEDRLPVLLDVVQSRVDGLMRRRQPAAAGRHAQRRAAGAVDDVREVDDRGLARRRRREHDRAGAVAKQNARRAIRVVDDARHHVRADDERMLDRAGRDQLASRRERVGESRTRRAEVEAPRVDRADLRLQRARRARKDRVGRRRADDDEADVVGREARLPRSPRARPARRCPTCHARLDDVPLADAGALENPLVGRLDHLLELRVGQHAWEARRSRVPRSSPAATSPQSILSRSRQSEVFVGARGRDAAARRAIEEADLDQIRLVDVLDRVLLLADRGRQAVEPDRAAAELVDDRLAAAADPLRRSRAASTSSSSSASWHTAAVMRPSARTCAKSRTRRSSRLAMRGVPRDRRAISSAAAGAISTPRIRADRATIVVEIRSCS